MKSFTRNSAAVIAGAMLTVSASSQAAMQTLMGDDLIFTYDDSTLFGTANVVGNSIFFLPTNFLAQATNTDGAVVVTDLVDIRIQVKEGSTFLIDSFALFESGDYQLVNTPTPGGNVDPGAPTVDVDAFLQVTSNTHLCMMGGFPLPCNMATTTDAGTLNNASGNLEQWSLSAGLDLDNMPIWGDDFDVTVRIQNTVEATSLELGDSALIQKKFGAIGVDVMAEVPVPAAAWLFGSALAGLVASRRRR